MGLLRFIFSFTFVKHLLIIAVFFLLAFAGLYVYLQSYTDYEHNLEVPDLKGMSIVEVDLALADIPLEYQVIDSVFNEGNYGTVLDQIPSSGAKVKENRVLFLTVNASSEPMKTVNVEIGETLRIAATKLEILGIQYETIFKPAICSNCILEILYRGKTIESGSKVRKGEKIVLVIGEKGEENVPVPDLYGMHLDSARNLLTRSSLSLGYPFYDEDIRSSEDSAAARIYDQRPISEKQELRAGTPVDVWLTTKSLPKKLKEINKSKGENK